MDNNQIGFSYFASPRYLTEKSLQSWLPVLKRLGGTTIIFRSDFSKAIPEDALRYAQENNLTPIIHFPVELPLARVLNDVIVLLDVYAKWGINYMIFGDKPNSKASWPLAGWHSDHLVDRFLDRFIPLANHSLRNGVSPVLAPMAPGGDYWDTAFIEKVLIGLERRRLNEILESLILSAYGYTFNKPLSWGAGGPECWPISRPYRTPDGQEDQLGFHNFEWVQAAAQRAVGKHFPVLILDAGNTGTKKAINDANTVVETMRRIYKVFKETRVEKDEKLFEWQALNKGADLFCTFSLDTIGSNTQTEMTREIVFDIFDWEKNAGFQTHPKNTSEKVFEHYLLLPSHTSGVSDVILSKVRPLIKHLKPTVGFSLDEASLASKVSVFPDPLLFSDDLLNQLRSAGCSVEVLPESGIEIATSVQRL